MPCFETFCCCVTLRMGGITMGLMTLTLSMFSIIPAIAAVINEALRTYLAQAAVYIVRQVFKSNNGTDAGESSDATQPALWGVVQKAINNPTVLPPENDESVVWMFDVMYVFTSFSLYSWSST